MRKKIIFCNFFIKLFCYIKIKLYICNTEINQNINQLNNLRL